jgi:ankyrin repeat protein
MKFPVNEQKKNGITALGIACFKGNAEILEILHKAGAILNSPTKKGISPLALAIKSKNFDCVKYLLDNKAEIMKS